MSLSSLMIELKACFSDSFKINEPLGNSHIISDKGKSISENFDIKTPTPTKESV